MAFIQPPSTFNAGSRLYFKRLYNAIVEEVNKATSLPVVNKMPINPKQGAYYFQNAIAGDPTITKQGTYVWTGSQWVGNVDEQQWGNSRISGVGVDKLLAGQIGAIEIVLADNVNSVIRSQNYSPGVTGWAIRGNGNAEFQNVVVRGSLWASDLVYGTISSARFGANTIGSGPVIGGALHNRYGISFQSSSIPYVASTNLNLSSCYISSGITLPPNADRTGALILVNVFYDWNGTNAPGWIIAGVLGGYRTNPLMARYMYYENGRDVLSFMTLHTTATVGQTYYLGIQQAIANPYNVLCYYDMAIIEFMK
jgi:hypothetical protein